MKKKNMIKALVAIMVLALAFSGLAGCASGSGAAEHVGTLTLKVNPEFGVNYDLDGNVTSIDARNEDAKALLKDYTDYVGKPSREVVKELVALMHKAGYFDMEVDGEGKTITIQVDPESQLPGVDFLPDVVSDVKGYLSDKQTTGKIAIEGESNYGMSEYAVSDYGETNFKTIHTTVTSGAARYTDYAKTDYDGYNTDYDAKTDYDGKNTDYETRIGAKTDYDGVNTDYGGKTDYDKSNTDYEKRIGAKTDYDGYNSDYGVNTDYDDVNTDYGYSDYSYSNSGSSSGSSSSNKSSNKSSSSSSSSGSSGSSSSSGGSSSSSSSSSSGGSSGGASSGGSSGGNTNYTNYDSNTNYDDNNSDYDD